MKLYTLALRVRDLVGRELTYYLHSTDDGLGGPSLWRLELSDACPFRGREVMRVLEAAVVCLDEIALALGKLELAMLWIAPLPLGAES